MSIATGEFFLRRRPNGSTVILLRSAWISLLLYTITIAAREAIAPSHEWRFDLSQLRLAISETLPWLGAIFAGSYAALYARFSSQWSYLADLYNQIMAVQVEMSKDSDTSKMDLWKAGFVEDAENLHLATKPVFASVIASVLELEGVRLAYTKYTPGGGNRLAGLEAKVAAVLARDSARYHYRPGTSEVFPQDRARDDDAQPANRVDSSK